MNHYYNTSGLLLSSSRLWVKRFSSLVLASFILLLNTVPAIAQCEEKKVRKLTGQYLGEYSYETASFRALTSFGNNRQIDAIFIGYGNEKYRVVNLCHGYSGDMVFQVLDSKYNVLFSNEKSVSGDKFDFTAPASGDYIVRYKFSADSKEGCVAFAIGYK